MTLNVMNSVNIANPGQTVINEKINERFLKVFEPNLLFWKFSEAPIWQAGHNAVIWVKPNRIELTPAQALLSPGVTPTSTETKLDSISVSSKQYGIYVTLSDELLRSMAGRDLPSVTSDLLGANMARIVDRVIQDEVIDNAQNRFYGSATSGGPRAANRAALTANDKVFAYDLAYAHTLLQGKFAPYVNGEYISFMHTNVAIWIQTEVGAWWFIEVSKYSRPDKIYKGEIGAYANVRIFVSPFIKTYQSNIKVYPTVFIGEEAYGAAQLQDMQMFVEALGSGGTTDPLHQRMTVGVKCFFAPKILQQDSILVLESAGIDS